MLDYAIESGRGGMCLHLSQEKFRALRGSQAQPGLNPRVPSPHPTKVSWTKVS
jgi:hypothetical protein